MRIGLGMSIVGGGGGLFTSLADIGGVPTAAYSVRKVNGAYSGAAIRVRESSGDIETDIGFDGENLDETALLAHCGANDGFVTKWYDQSGSGYDAVQATAGSQPKIVSAGTVIKENGLPALDFDGVDDALLISDFAYTTSALFTSTVFKRDTDGSIFAHYDTGANQRSWIVRVLNQDLQFVTSSNGTLFFIADGGAVATAQKLWVNQFDGSLTGSDRLKGYINGEQLTYVGAGGTESLPSSLHNSTASLSIGSLLNSGAVLLPYDGKIQELTMYASDKSSLRTAIEGNINGYYVIYGVTYFANRVSADGGTQADASHTQDVYDEVFPYAPSLLCTCEAGKATKLYNIIPT